MTFNISEIKEYYKKAAAFYAAKDFESAYNLFYRLDAKFDELAKQGGAAIKTKIAPIANRIKMSLAETALETRRIDQAFTYYSELDMKVQAAYVALFQQKLDLAMELVKDEPVSPGSKWIIFLVGLFSQKTTKLKNPGYLVFRLYLEATARYCIMYNCHAYLGIFDNYKSSLEASFPDFRKSIASAFLGLDMNDAGIQLLEDALKFDNGDAEIYFKLGKTFFAMNRRKDAQSSFEKALKLMPGHMATQRYLFALK